MQAFNNSNNLKNGKKFFYLFLLTYLMVSLIHLLIRNFFLSNISCIFLGIISLFFLSKAKLIPKKSQFILKAILIIFIFIAFLSLFLV